MKNYWNPKMKEYMLSGWNDYRLVDSKDDFIALLNILEACRENLDSLHDVCFNHNGRATFCDIQVNVESDRELVNVLFENFRFFSSEEELHDYLCELTDGFDCTSLPEAMNDYDMYITKTEDGYVFDCRC